MSLIFGVVARNGETIPDCWLTNMKQALSFWKPDREDSYIDTRASLGCLVRFNTPESRFERSKEICNGPDTQIVFDGRIDNRKELIDVLCIPANRGASVSDESLVVAAFLRWGNHCCEHLIGDFVFAIWQPGTRSLFFARDQLGVRPLFLAESDSYIAFASNKNALLALPWVDRTLSRQWIADFLCICITDQEQSLYEGIRAFPPAHVTSIRDGKPVLKRRYWQLDVGAELCLKDDADYLERFNELLEQAVQCRLRTAFPVASELSGGIDSTTVTSLANRLVKRTDGPTLIACSHVLAPEHENVFYPYTDEKPWISDLCSFAGIANHLPLTAVRWGMQRSLENTVRLHAGPAHRDLTLYGDELLEEIQHLGCRVLLSGFGGDQLVTSHGWGFFDELGANASPAELWKELRAETGTWVSIRCLGKWLLRNRIPGMDSIFERSARSRYAPEREWEKRLEMVFICRKFGEKFGYPERLRNYPTLAATGTVRQREFQQIEKGNLQARLGDSAVGAESAGVEYRYPLLDKRLMEFCLSLPVLQKRRGGVDRRMVRTATQNVLPESIRWRNDKTKATVPTIQYRLFVDRKKIVSSIETFAASIGDCEFLDWKKVQRFATNIGRDSREYHFQRRPFLRTYQLAYALHKQASESSN